MIKKANVQEVIDKIDAEHYVSNLEQLASNAQSEQVKLGATIKILEIVEIIKPANKKASATSDGTNLQLVIEE